MSATGEAPSLPFSEDELFRASSLALAEDEARHIASSWGRVPDKVASGELIGSTLAEGTYLLLSLLGGTTAERVQSLYLPRLSEPERVQFEQRRTALRRKLEDDGKL